MIVTVKPGQTEETTGQVYCPICTHIVQATILHSKKRDITKPGQTCPHCRSSLDPGYVLHWDKAA